MHYIQLIIDEVNRTHPGLGELAAVCAITAKSHKTLLIVSPSGCGKSRIMEWVARHYPDAQRFIKISLAGLAKKADVMNDFNSVIVVDDIATTQTDYSRISSITTLTALVYTHYYSSAMGGSDGQFEIHNFNGSALIGIQPIMLRTVMQSAEWDGSIQDKCLRYYHLQRPTEPNFTMPDVNPYAGIDESEVTDYKPDNGNLHWQRLKQLSYMQWSASRAKEYLLAYLRAMAAIDGRNTVEDIDLELLEKLLRPMAYEPLAVVKEDLEGQRVLDNNLLLLLTEYYTYGGKFQLAHLAIDYKILIGQAYKIMGKQSAYWEQISKSPTVYKPTKLLLAEMKKYRLDIVSTETAGKQGDLI